MSQLPPRPSLVRLRKQAKDLLRRLRQQDPDATLGRAQHALAREYGFASWPKLKLHVERLVALPQPVTFQRYTAKARAAVFFSRYEASQLGSHTIEPGHLLLGVMRASHGLESWDWGVTAASLERTRLEMAAGRPANEAGAAAGRMATSARAQRVFRAAVEEADALAHRDIGLAHLLLGVLREPDPLAAALLDRAGMHLQAVRDRIAQLLDEGGM